MTAVRRFTHKPATIDAIQWDGSDEARSLIAGQSGKPVPYDTSRGALSVWVQRIAGWRWLPFGDWAVAEADGTGVYLLPAEVIAAEWEPADAEVTR